MTDARETHPRSPYLGLARPSCAQCSGSGLDRTRVCSCCYRAIADEVLSAYATFSATVGLSIRNIRWDTQPGAKGRRTLGNRETRRVEFCADVLNAGRRALTSDEYRLFRARIDGVRQTELCTKLHLDEGLMWHSWYRTKQKLGAAFVSLKPFALWPVSEYLQGQTSDQTTDTRPFPVPQPPRENSRWQPLRPILAAPVPKALEPVSVVVMPAPKPKPQPPDAQNDMLAFVRYELAEGHTVPTIAARLNALKIPNKAGEPWTPRSLRLYLIANPVRARERNASYTRRKAA